MWEKDASRNFEQEGYRRDIVRLIQSVNRMNLKEFYNFCINTHDNEYYSRYVSLDNAIGCQHHDFAHNHKIYFDPYRGKYFPIYWDAGELSVSNKKLDIIGNPFLNKWKLIPEFDLLRQKTLYRLINDGVLNSENIINLIDKYDKLVRPALKADIFRMFVNRKRTSILKFPPSSPSEPFFMSEYDRMVLDFKLQIKQRIEMIKRYLSKNYMLSSLKYHPYIEPVHFDFVHMKK